MSVSTSADQNVDQAKKNIQSAINNLSRIIVDKCWGCDDYKTEYLDDIRKIFYELIDMRDRLR